MFATMKPALKPNPVAGAVNKALERDLCRRSCRTNPPGTHTKPIEDICVGDLVWAWDENLRSLVRRPVARLFRHQSKPIIVVTMVDGDGAEQRIEATTEHPFWVESKGWVAACKLQTGDVLQRIDGGAGLRVASAQLTGTCADVFNFEVQRIHNYFVGAQGVLVHNESEKSPAGYDLGDPKWIRTRVTLDGEARLNSNSGVALLVAQEAHKSLDLLPTSLVIRHIEGYPTVIDVEPQHFGRVKEGAFLDKQTFYARNRRGASPYDVLLDIANGRELAEKYGVPWLSARSIHLSGKNLANVGYTMEAGSSNIVKPKFIVTYLMEQGHLPSAAVQQGAAVLLPYEVMEYLNAATEVGSAVAPKLLNTVRLNAGVLSAKFNVDAGALPFANSITSLVNVHGRAVLDIQGMTVPPILVNDPNTGLKTVATFKGVDASLLLKQGDEALSGLIPDPEGSFSLSAPITGKHTFDGADTSFVQQSRLNLIFASMLRIIANGSATFTK